MRSHCVLTIPDKARDRLVNRTLRRAGCGVLRVWEPEPARKNEARLLRRIQRNLHSPSGR